MSPQLQRLGGFPSQAIGPDVPLRDEDVLPRIAGDAADGVLRRREPLALGLPTQGAQEETVLAVQTKVIESCYRTMGISITKHGEFAN